MHILMLAALLACSSSPEERAIEVLEADGMSDIELTGEAGIFEFRADKGAEMCAGTVDVPTGGGEIKIEKYCSSAWGPEELKLPVRVSKQGRDRAHGCDAGDQKLCALLGTDYRDGTNGIAGDKDNAIRLFESSCEAGAYQGCTYMADVYDQGKLVERNDDKAQALYTKSCELGSEVSCRRLGKTVPGAEPADAEDGEDKPIVPSDVPPPVPG